MSIKSSKWDKIKQTLTTFDRSEFEKAAAAQQPSTGKDTPVPSGRTTLILDPTIKAPSVAHFQAASQPIPKEPSVPSLIQNTDPVSQPLVAESPKVEQPIAPPVQPVDARPQPPLADTYVSSNATPVEFINSDQPQLQPQPSPPVSIQQAALKVKASTPKRDQTTRGQLNVRIDPALKEVFEKTCKERGMNMSKVITSMIKTWMGLSLFIFTVYAQQKSYSSPDICSYILKHSGYGVSSYIPPINTTLSGRQALYNKGVNDSFPNLSNSRLDFRVDIPITPYYSDRSKQKTELQAYIYKHLSTILAASQIVSAYDSHVKLLQSRLSYMEGQVKLQLANKTQLFTLEDELLKSKASLYEAQSTLDQRIIELAMSCGSDWQEAYGMVKKWDCKLFND